METSWGNGKVCEDIEEKLLPEALVLRNMDMVKQVDDFIILTISRTNQCLTNDSSLENF